MMHTRRHTQQAGHAQLHLELPHNDPLGVLQHCCCQAAAAGVGKLDGGKGCLDVGGGNNLQQSNIPEACIIPGSAGAVQSWDAAPDEQEVLMAQTTRTGCALPATAGIS